MNRGLLPQGYIAMAEQVTGRPIPDVVALHTSEPGGEPRGGGARGVAIAQSPPSARLITRLEKISYAKRADRVVIRHGRGKVVAIIEVVSPGNKDSRSSIRAFVEKAADILNQGVNLLVVDLFPPTPRDPYGIHQAIWDELGEERFEEVPGKPLIAASFLGGDLPTAYVEPLGRGRRAAIAADLPFARPLHPAPLEETYQQAWDVFPALLKGLMGGNG